MPQNKTLFENSAVAIGLPVGGESVHWRFSVSLLEMVKTPVHGIIVRQGSLVDMSRNEIVKMMLDHPARFTHLLFLDSDMAFPVDTIQILVAHDQPVVSGLCFSKVPPFSACVFNRTGEKQGRGDWQKGGVADLREGLNQVSGVGTGCLLIKRSVFETLSYPWFAIGWEGDKQRGEDIFFAEKCFLAGIPVFVDTSIVTTHMTSAGVAKDPEGMRAVVKVL